MSEEKREGLTKPANRIEVDAFYGLTVALSELFYAQEHMEKRLKMIPGGWRDIRMVSTVLAKLLRKVLETFEPVKRRQIDKASRHMRHKITFGPEAAKEPEMFLITTEDLGVILCAATEHCKLCMGTRSQCKQCQLGKALDSTSFVSAGDRAWWEVFEQARYKDIGMEE